MMNAPLTLGQLKWDTTKKARLSSVKFMFERGCLSDLRDVQGTLEKLRGLENRKTGGVISEATLRDKLSHISLYIAALGDDFGPDWQDYKRKYNHASKELQREQETHNREAQCSPQEAENYVEPAGLAAFCDKMLMQYRDLLDRDPREPLSMHDFSNLQEMVIVACYTLNPNVRSAWYSVKYKNVDPATDNFLMLESRPAKVVWTNYKTRATYGQIILDLGDDLAGILRKFVKFRHPRMVGEHEYLFYNAYGVAYGAQDDADAFSHLIRRIYKREFGKAIGARNLRIFTTSALLEGKKSFKELRDAALSRHQSITALLKYLRKDPNDGAQKAS